MWKRKDMHEIMNNGIHVDLSVKNDYVKLGKILDVEEPEFGCEGRQPGEIITAKITIQWKMQRNTTVCQIPEKLLYESGLDEGQWIIRWQDTFRLYDEEKKLVSKAMEQFEQWVQQEITF